VITAQLERGECPDCGGFIFRPGPRGGITQNIECVGCKSRFNVAHWQRVNPRVLIFAQRIESEAAGGGAWRTDMFPQVLE
jgi:hypothetical protein